MHRALVGIIAMSAAATACGSDGRPSPSDGGFDAGADAGGVDAAADSGAPDAGVLNCAELLGPGAAFALDPAGLDAQIHPSTVFDGEGIWIAYNTVEEGDTGLFDVWATRIRCDGTPWVAPFRVNTTLPFNDVDPAIALAGRTMLVTWSSDDRVGATDNMHGFVRPLDVEGTPVTGSDVELRTSRIGSPIVDNHLTSAVAPSDGGFLVAGHRAVIEAARFQIYVQRVDQAGALVGEAAEPFFEPMVTQLNPALCVPEDGIPWVAWDRGDGVEDQVVYLHLNGGTASPQVVVEGLASSSGVSLAADATRAGVVYAAIGSVLVGTAQDIRLVDLSTDPATRSVAIIGNRVRNEVSPLVAPHPAGGGAVAFHRIVSGFQTDMFAVRFTYDGSELLVGPEVSITTGTAPYQPALTHVDGDTWFAAWAARVGDTFRLEGRFVEIPAT